jgi:hypothetical protein
LIGFSAWIKVSYFRFQCTVSGRVASSPYWMSILAWDHLYCYCLIKNWTFVKKWHLKRYQSICRIRISHV